MEVTHYLELTTVQVHQYQGLLYDLDTNGNTGTFKKMLST